MTLRLDSDIHLLRGPVPLTHLFLRSFVFEGDKAVDATCGNGLDTVALAKLTGFSGHVWGFDVQEEAIAETGRRVDEAGLSGHVTLLHTGHEEMEKHLNGSIKFVLFNLGYLPGGDHSLVTRPDTTRIALNQSLKLIAPGGIVLVTVYPGHEGGVAEQLIVNEWAAGLEPREYHSWRMGQMNVMADAPYCILVQKGA